MVRIVLNDEQAAMLRQAGGAIQFVDRTGRDLGRLVPSRFHENSERPSDATVALQRMTDAEQGGVFYSTQEVLAHLDAAE